MQHRVGESVIVGYFVLTAIESTQLKLRRATEHLRLIEYSIWEYVASEPYKIIAEPNGDETLHIIREPPSDIGIIAGEIVYQLRSSLDYLAFDLVKLNRLKTPLPADWEERCCFPLFVKVPKKTPVYNCFERQLPNISKTAFALIERVQPYHRLGSTNPLELLANLSNIDKHRHLNVTLARIAHNEFLTTAGSGRIHVGRTGLKHGTKLTHIPKQPYPTVDVKQTFTAYVIFDERAMWRVELMDVQEALKLIIEYLESDLIPAFVHLLK